MPHISSLLFLMSVLGYGKSEIVVQCRKYCSDSQPNICALQSVERQ